MWTLNADGESKVTRIALHHLHHNGWRKPSVLMHHQLINTPFGWLSCMKTDLNHQLIVVSEDGEQGREGSVARSLRETREMLFNEKYPWNWANALAFRAAENVANRIQSVPDEIAIISTEASALFSFPQDIQDENWFTPGTPPPRPFTIQSPVFIEKPSNINSPRPFACLHP